MLATHITCKRDELDDVRPYIDAGRKHRLPFPELFDAGNIDPDTGDVAPLSAAQVIGNKVGILQDETKTDDLLIDKQANELFHVDSSFNARRAGFSLLLAHILPPAGVRDCDVLSLSYGSQSPFNYGPNKLTVSTIACRLAVRQSSPIREQRTKTFQKI